MGGAIRWRAARWRDDNRSRSAAATIRNHALRRADMRPGPLTQDQLVRFDRDGFLLVPTLFDAEEISLLLRSAKEDRALDEHAFGRSDGEGGRVRLSLW